jgi:ribosomal-protein-alanine acetyltransferase
MIIRPATPADIPALMDLAAQSETAAHWRRGDYERLFDPGAPSRVAMVIEAEALVGFVVALAVGTEWEIENVVVQAATRRRGLGAQLLREFLLRARAAGVQSIFLEVRESNVAARGLYEDAGFRQSGTRMDYYSGPVENAIVYRLVLDTGENPLRNR